MKLERKVNGKLKLERNVNWQLKLERKMALDRKLALEQKMPLEWKFECNWNGNLYLNTMRNGYGNGNWNGIRIRKLTGMGTEMNW